MDFRPCIKELFLQNPISKSIYETKEKETLDKEIDKLNNILNFSIQFSKEQDFIINYNFDTSNSFSDYFIGGCILYGFMINPFIENDMMYSLRLIAFMDIRLNKIYVNLTLIEKSLK